MADEKKAFSETRIYPVFFMIIVAVFFGIILAVFYHTTKDRVAMHAELRYKNAVLSLFNLPTDDVEKSYVTYIEEREKENLSYYVASDEEETLGYCFHIVGNGLWGTITALIAVDTEFEEMLGLYILEQNETPGLGGRITEDDFLQQFTGKKVKSDSTIVKYSLVGESETASEDEVNQITGATSSSKAVVDMLYNSFQEIITVFNHRLD